MKFVYFIRIPLEKFSKKTFMLIKSITCFLCDKIKFFLILLGLPDGYIKRYLLKTSLYFALLLFVIVVFYLFKKVLIVSFSYPT